ncbi:hypothetical protein [Marinobacter salicampi]|uniref:hypothetical protein n=1 Tax=Marinobacter salicampi TaxID=435907 RepID=UPI0014078329|nr:hypothetical protein [Marinobacter salicampi]
MEMEKQTIMNKTFLAGAVLLGFAVYCLMGTFGVGGDTLGFVLIELGVPEEYSDNGSRMLSGLLFATAIVLQVMGYSVAADGRVVSTEEVQAVMKAVREAETNRGDGNAL